MQDHTVRPWRLDELTWVLDRQEPNGTYATHALAHAGTRALALLADVLIQAALLTAAALLLFACRPSLGENIRNRMSDTPWNLPAGLGALLLLHMLLMLVLELLSRGRTPGKALCRLRVVGTDGHRPSFRQILIRNLLRPLDWIPAGYVAGGLLAAGSEWRQRLGDRLARTVVIFDPPLRDLLAQTATPVSAYSTSEDGYLLEAFLARESRLAPEFAATLAARLAAWFHQAYPSADPLLRDLHARGSYSSYLLALYRQERSVETYDTVPSGLPEAPPPVED